MANGNSYENPELSNLTYKRQGETVNEEVADDSEKTVIPEETKNSKTKALDQAKSTHTMRGERRPLMREAIGNVLPEGTVRQKMLSKAEKKREKLEAKFGEREYSAPNDAINAKDQETFSKLSQGQQDIFNRQQQDMIGKTLFRKG